MSFLKSKSADPLAGVMQGITPEGGAPGYTPQEMQNPDTAPMQNVMQAGAPQAEPRRSLLGTLGQLSDVFARVGGAEAQYQPTLDAMQARQFQVEDRAQQTQLNQQKLMAGDGALGDAGRLRLTQAVRGTQALLAANPNADISKVFPLLAERTGVDPNQAATLAGRLAEDPSLLEGLAGLNDSGDKYGGSVIYAKGPDGNVVAFQPNLKGGKGRAILPQGFTAVDPLKFVDTGDKQIGVGTRSGDVGQTFTKGVKPDTVANNRTAITVAGMPARAKPAAAGKTDDKAAAGNSEALIALDNLENGFRDLHKMKALPGDDSGVVGNVLSALGRTGVGQQIGEQMGNEAAQRRVALQKTVNTLQQTLIKALPASATRTKFEQEILAKSLPDPSRMSLDTAQQVIGDYRAIFKRAQAAAAAAPTRKLPPRIDGGKSGGGGRTLVYNPATGKIE